MATPADDGAVVCLEERRDSGCFAVAAAAVMGEPRKGDSPTVDETGTNACTWGVRLLAVTAAAAAATAPARWRPILCRVMTLLPSVAFDHTRR